MRASDGAELSIPPSELTERTRRLQGSIADHGLPAALVVSRGGCSAESGADVLYLTNHFTSFALLPDVIPGMAGFGYAALVVPADGQATLLVENPDYRSDLVVADEVRVTSNLWDEIPTVLLEAGIGAGSIGLIGEQMLSFRGQRALASRLPEIELLPADHVIESLRRIKSPAELALLRNATDVGSKMTNAFLEAAVPGATEADCVAAAHAVGLPLGAMPWAILSTSGPLSSYYSYHRNPTWDHVRPLQSGDLIHVDLSGTVHDYQYDLERTAVVGGEATPAQRALMEAAREVIEHIVEHVRPEASVGDLHAAGATWLAENAPARVSSQDGASDFHDSFPSFGHGIGLTWERPYIMADEELALQEGMVLAIETVVPGDVGAAGFEHDVIVTSGDPEILTSGARSVWWD